MKSGLPGGPEVVPRSPLSEHQLIKQSTHPHEDQCNMFSCRFKLRNCVTDICWNTTGGIETECGHNLRITSIMHGLTDSVIRAQSMFTIFAMRSLSHS